MRRALTTVVPLPAQRIRLASGWIARLLEAAPLLAWAGLALMLSSLPTLLMALVDPRQFQGLSVWIKPWKFQVSTATFLWTLAWVLAWLPAAQRSGWWARGLSGVAVGSAMFEVVYITWQAAWGRASHFNVATPMDTTMYALMGVGAVLLSSTALVLGVLVLRSRRFALSDDLRLAIGWGLVLSFLLGTGFGAYLSSQPGHWVGGLPSDANGMLLTGWSRGGGDLRVAHFFGIHAVHFLVAWVWLVGRARPWLALGARPDGAAVSTGFVYASGLVYCLFSSWTFVQAVLGSPFFG